jgi:hypothetical protein
MQTLKFNGEFWYEDRTALWSRIATWLVWVGGGKSMGGLTPISLLGHRVTIQRWGAYLRLPNGDQVVVSWCGVDPSKWWRTRPVSLYVSPDGTPGNAHTWFIGAPREVRKAVERTGARRPFGSWVPGAAP